MLPGDQLQKFVVRLITGYGERVQDNISEPELHTASQKLSSLAGAECLFQTVLVRNVTILSSLAFLVYLGLASISFQKKEKINKLVDEALDRDLGIVMVNGKPALSEGVKTVMTYLTNCRGDIRVSFYAQHHF